MLDFKLLREKNAESLTLTRTSLMNESGEDEFNTNSLHKEVEGIARGCMK